jgi:hypothetical protein
MEPAAWRGAVEKMAIRARGSRGVAWGMRCGFEVERPAQRVSTSKR